jgi:hypothetical protein
MQRATFLKTMLAGACSVFLPRSEQVEDVEQLTDAIYEFTGDTGLPYDPATGFPIGTLWIDPSKDGTDE